MIVSLKKSIHFVVKACPEYKISGQWLSMQIEETLETLFESSFNVKAVVTDNHSTNVLSFNILRSKYGEKDNKLSFNFMGHTIYIYIYNLYDSMHLIKNVINNFVNSKCFVFPSFEFTEFEDNIPVDAGEISWYLLHNVHEKDEKPFS